MKIPPVGSELFIEERRTDTTKIIVALRKLCERAQKTVADG